MSRDSPEDADRLLNGAEIRVFGGLLVGIGISPLVLAILTFPLGSVFDPEVIVLFRYGLSVLLAVFGLTMLHAVGLFYSGDWQSLWVVLTARNSKPRKPSTRSRSLRRLNWTRARLALSVRQDHTRDRMAMHSPADGHEPPQPTALSAGDPSVARMARGTCSLEPLRSQAHEDLARLFRAARQTAGTLDSARHD